MLNLNSLMIGTMQPEVLAAFYEKILGRPADMKEGKWSGWKVGSTFFSVGEHSEMKGNTKEPGRIMFNFETEKVKEDFADMVKKGAKPVKEPYQMGNMWIA